MRIYILTGTLRDGEPTVAAFATRQGLAAIVQQMPLKLAAPLVELLDMAEATGRAVPLLDEETGPLIFAASTADGGRWPTMTPPDFRSLIQSALSGRNVQAADIWTETRDWLIKHGVEAPANLPQETRR